MDNYNNMGNYNNMNNMNNYNYAPMNNMQNPPPKKKKGAKIFLIIFTIVAIIGLIVAGAGFAVIGFDINNLAWATETDIIRNTFVVEDNVTAITTDLHHNQVNIVRGESFGVSYPSSQDFKNSMDIAFNVQNGVLSITDIAAGSFNLGIQLPVLSRLSGNVLQITITIPYEFAGDINIRTRNNQIRANDIGNLNVLRLVTSNSSIIVSNGSVPTGLNLQTSNGTIIIRNFQANSLIATTSNAPITVEGFVSPYTVYIRTTNGNVTANNIETSRTLTIRSSNGAVQLGNSTADRVEINTSNRAVVMSSVRAHGYVLRTSNSNITIISSHHRHHYNFYLRTSNNNVLIGGAISGRSHQSSGGQALLDARTSNGVITVSFI